MNAFKFKQRLDATYYTTTILLKRSIFCAYLYVHCGSAFSRSHSPVIVAKY